MSATPTTDVGPSSSSGWPSFRWQTCVCVCARAPRCRYVYGRVADRDALRVLHVFAVVGQHDNDLSFPRPHRGVLFANTAWGNTILPPPPPHHRYDTNASVSAIIDSVTRHVCNRYTFTVMRLRQYFKKKRVLENLPKSNNVQPIEFFCS